MLQRPLLAILLGACLLPLAPAAAQTLPVDDPVLKRIWAEGMDSSQTYRLAQALMDSIGPRLTGTPGIRSGNDWLVSMYSRWGISARNEQYGTWRGWRRGVTHVDLVAPRVRSLEAMLLAWSAGTPRGQRVAGPVVLLPDLPDSAAFAAWLPQARDKFVLLSMPQETCRPDSAYRQWAVPASFDSMVARRNRTREGWNGRMARTGYNTRTLPVALERAGARGLLTSNWSAGWGVNKIFNARTERIPTLDVSCEDYGLLFRLAEHGQGPVIQVEAQAEFLGEVPVFNTIAEIRGSERPEEYVVLSAHFDSWDGASGATDNGTGTVTMLEAMRLLKLAYPRPKRTILGGHWSGEEQGLNGSRAFAEDHPEVVRGLQALFNQDNGTGRVVNLSASGLVSAGALWADWISRLPAEITRHFDNISFPGSPAGGGSDHASFACYGAPGFGLGSNSWDYGTYTWHTNRDSFDKIVFDEVRNNATLTAMLVYLASEDPRTTPRDRRIMTTRQGQPAQWPECQKPARSSAESTR